MNVKLKELNAKCNQTIENFDVSKELSPSSSLRGNLAGLKDLQLKIVELQVQYVCKLSPNASLQLC